MVLDRAVSVVLNQVDILRGYASEFAAKVNIPDMSALIPPDYFKTLMPALNEMAKNMSAMVAMTFPREQLESMQKTFAQTSGLVLRDSVYDSYAEMMRGLTPALQGFAQATVVPEIQASMSAMASSLTAAIDTARIQDILASASALRKGFADQDLDELTDEFFENNPDFAESIEKSPALYALSKADRRLIVWLVGIIVTLYVATTLLNIGTDNPGLKAFVDAFGLDFGGGVPAGITAAAATNKALSKLPQEEAE